MPKTLLLPPIKRNFLSRLMDDSLRRKAIDKFHALEAEAFAALARVRVLTDPIEDGPLLTKIHFENPLAIVRERIGRLGPTPALIDLHIATTGLTTVVANLHAYESVRKIGARHDTFMQAPAFGFLLQMNAVDPQGQRHSVHISTLMKEAEVEAKQGDFVKALEKLEVAEVWCAPLYEAMAWFDAQVGPLQMRLDSLEGFTDEELAPPTRLLEDARTQTTKERVELRIKQTQDWFACVGNPVSSALACLAKADAALQALPAAAPAIIGPIEVVKKALAAFRQAAAEADLTQDLSPLAQWRIPLVNGTEALMYEVAAAQKPVQKATFHSGIDMFEASIRQLGSPVSADAIRPEMNTMRGLLQTARAQVDKEAFDLAQATLDRIESQRAAAASICEACEAFQGRLTEVTKTAKSTAKEEPGMTQHLQAMLRDARQLAAPPRRNYAGANRKLDTVREYCKVPTDYGKRLDEADKHRKEVAAQLKLDASAARLLVQDWSVKLLSHPGAECLIERNRKALESGSQEEIDPSDRDFTAKVLRLADLCENVEPSVCAYAAYLTLQTQFVSQYDKLPPTHTLVKTRRPAVDKIRQTASGEVRARNYGLAFFHLHRGLQEIQAIEMEMGRLDALRANLADLQAARSALSQAEPGAADKLGKDITDFDHHVRDIAAALNSSTFNVMAIEGALRRAEVLLALCQTRLQVNAKFGSTEATREKLLSLYELPGGAEALDTLVAGLGESDNSDVAWRALELQMNLAMGAASKEYPFSLSASKELYQTLTKVPPRHLEGIRKVHFGRNSFAPDSLQIVEDSDDGSGGKFATPTELPDVRENSKPVPGVQPKELQWRVLHAVGLALNARQRFMEGKKGDPAFGDWQEHTREELVTEQIVALGISSEHRAGAIKVLTNGLGAIPMKDDDDDDDDDDIGPSPEVAALPQDLQDRLIKIHGTIVDSGGIDTWKDGTKCSTPLTEGGYVMGGRTYHRAADDDKDCYSYPADARKDGITCLQFRSPGDWFAELYAAYGCGVLRPQHPAMQWLPRLFGRDQAAV